MKTHPQIESRGLSSKIILYFLIILGVVLRLYKWNGFSLWYDECQWLLAWQKNFIFSWKSACVWLGKPPVFAFLVHYWSLVSQNEFVLRFLPVFFGISSFFIYYRLTKVLFGEKVALIALCFLSFSPLHIYYSQEFTHYSLTLFLALFSVYYLIISLRENKTFLWIGFACSTIISLYSNYFLVFLLIAENLFFFIVYRKDKGLLKKWLMVQAVISLFLLPILSMFSSQVRAFALYPNNWIPRGSLLHIFQTLRLFNVGYNANFIINLGAALVFFPLLIIGIWANIKKEITTITLLVVWLFIPMILALLISRIIPVYLHRNFFFSLPAYYILIALGICKLKKYRFVAVALCILTFVFSLFNYYGNIFPYPEEFYRNGVHAKRDDRAANKYIASNFKAQDTVIHVSRSTTFPHIYYFYLFNNLKPVDIINFFIGQKNNQIFTWEHLKIISEEGEIKSQIQGYKRLWLIFSAWEPQLLAAYPMMVENRIKNALDRNFGILDTQEFDGINVYLYKIN